jgi:hypothetical protein
MQGVPVGSFVAASTATECIADAENAAEIADCLETNEQGPSRPELMITEPMGKKAEAEVEAASAGAEEAASATEGAATGVGEATTMLSLADDAVEGVKVEEDDGDKENLMNKVKAAGVAGAISYAAWELGFWSLSVPVALFAYYEFTGVRCEQHPRRYALCSR